MGWLNALYDFAKAVNDANAVHKDLSGRRPGAISRRVGRRLYGKLAGHVARKLFG
jgi:hypothetical protein